MANQNKAILNENPDNIIRYLNYKGYIGGVEFSELDNVFHGKVLGIQSLISFEGQNLQEITNDFHESIDEYLEMCIAENIKPEKPLKDLVWEIFLEGLHGFSDDFMKDGRELQDDQERESFDL